MAQWTYVLFPQRLTPRNNLFDTRVDRTSRDHHRVGHRIVDLVVSLEFVRFSTRARRPN